MATHTTDSLCQSKCVPCEGGVPVLTPTEVQDFLKAIPLWSRTDDGKAIYRQRKLKSFAQGLQWLNAIGEIAEADQHHPDLHLTGYRNVRVELTTHAIGGLSENDFIIAAKIDQLGT